MVTRAAVKADFVNGITDSNMAHSISIELFQDNFSSGSYDTSFVTKSGATIAAIGAFRAVGRQDIEFMPEGALKTNDVIMYLAGSVETPVSGGNVSKMKVTMSGAGDVFQVIGGGVQHFPPDSDPVYKKCFLRTLAGGSFY